MILPENLCEWKQWDDVGLGIRFPRIWIQLWGKPVNQRDQVSSSRAAIVKMWSPNQHRLGTGTWVAQSVERPTSAQVTMSQFMSSSPASGSVLTARSLEPVSYSVSPSLSSNPLFMLCLCLSHPDV